MDEDVPPDVDALVAELRARVDQRRADGEYPPGLEADLDAHFRRLAVHRERRTFAHLHEALDVVHGAGDVGLHRMAAGSQLPGGDALHKLVARLVSQQTAGVLLQVKAFAEAVEATLRLVVADVEEPAQHAHLELLGQLEALQDRLARQERLDPGPDRALRELRSRVEQLEVAERNRSIDPWWGNEAFEAAFRGGEEDLRARYADLADRFVGHGPVLDLGCGRGEFLQLLADRDVEAWGVEIDGQLVTAARASGLDVVHDDGVATLAGLPDGSLGGLVMVQVIEHLPAQLAVDVVRTAAAKVAPGGLVVVETVNPQSLYVYARAFYLDPTHDRPVHPAFLSFLFQQAGFAGVDIDWRSPPPPDEVLAPVASGTEDLDAALNGNVDRLNQLLFAPQGLRRRRRPLIAVPEIHQVITAAAPGDAVTGAALALRDLLRRVGPSEIYARHVAPALAHDVHELRRYVRRPSSATGTALLVYHASIGDRDVRSFLLQRPEALVLLYHNITPSPFIRPWDPALADELDEGRLELVALRPRVARALAVSRYNAAELAALGYRDVAVVPPIVDPHRLLAGTPQPSTMRHFAEGVRGPVVLFVGQLLPHKRPDLLLQVAHLLGTYHRPEAQVVVVGAARLPAYQQALARYQRQLNLANVWITGAVPDEQLAAFYRSADVFLTVSEHEGFCVPLLEAMAFDVPVVARRHAAVPEDAGTDRAAGCPPTPGPSWWWRACWRSWPPRSAATGWWRRAGVG